MYRYNYQEGEMIGALMFLCRVEGEAGRPAAKFMCPCGKEFISRIDAVKVGRTKSCGCMTKQLQSESLTKYAPLEYFENGVKKIPFISKENEERFWSKVNITESLTNCWEWTHGGERYGHFKIGKGEYKASRIAYFLHYGEDPGILSVMHSCDNPKCCNPNHLSLGTQNENMQDMTAKGRVNKGATVKTAKLNEIQVTEIRRLRSIGVSAAVLSKDFGVSGANIRSIVTGKSWKHIL